jgi:hypothetical protein
MNVEPPNAEGSFERSAPRAWSTTGGDRAEPQKLLLVERAPYKPHRHCTKATAGLPLAAAIISCALLVAGCRTAPRTTRHSQPESHTDRHSIVPVEDAIDCVVALPMFPQPLSDIYAIYRLPSHWVANFPMRRSESSAPGTIPPSPSPLRGAESREADAMRQYQQQWDAHRDGRRLTAPTLYPSRLDERMEAR